MLPPEHTSFSSSTLTTPADAGNQAPELKTPRWNSLMQRGESRQGNWQRQNQIRKPRAEIRSKSELRTRNPSSGNSRPDSLAIPLPSAGVTYSTGHDQFLGWADLCRAGCPSAWQRNGGREMGLSASSRRSEFCPRELKPLWMQSHRQLAQISGSRRISFGFRPSDFGFGSGVFRGKPDDTPMQTR
jgi:hypothetical protein